MNDADKALESFIRILFNYLKRSQACRSGVLEPRHITKPQSLLQVPNPNAVGENNYHARKKIKLEAVCSLTRSPC